MTTINTNNTTTMTTTNTAASIGLNEFIYRQLGEAGAASKYSHFSQSEVVEDDYRYLKEIAAENFPQATPGYRDGVVLVPVNPCGFWSGVVEVTPETELKTSFGARRKGEAPYLQTVAVGGKKLQAVVVELVLYRRDVLLEEGPDAVSTEADWEIVSINARPMEGVEPLNPVTMARNFLAREGGTKGEFTAEEFAKAIEYWSTRVMCG